MKEIISCCGVVCSGCEYYPETCGGCPAIEGRVFWTAYTGDAVCPIYQCCVTEKMLPHCGLCGELPCTRYDLDDPTKSPEQNRADLESQMATLKKLTVRE